MQHPRAVAALLIQIEQTRQRARVFSGVQRKPPITLGIIRQTRIAEPGATLERQPQNQVHALPGTEPVQCLRQCLHGRAMVLRGAVGGSDQHGSDLRIGFYLIFEHLQIQPARVEAALHRHLHIGHQRRAVGLLTASLEKHRQRHTRRQRRHFAEHLFPGIEQQPLQTLGQAFHVQRLGQIRRRRQRNRFAHAGAVVAAAHQNERQRRIAFALPHAAQHVQTIDAGQLPVDDSEVIRHFAKQRHRLLTIGAQIQPRIATHVQQHLFEQVARPRVGLGNQHSGYGG